jgi:hypothetical protein
VCNCSHHSNASGAADTISPRELAREQQARRIAMRRVSRCCTLASKILALRAAATERTADRAAKAERIKGEAARRRKAADLRRVAAMLADVGTCDGMVDVLTLWGRPTTFAKRMSGSRPA